jgi:hypothetical protein
VSAAGRTYFTFADLPHFSYTQRFAGFKAMSVVYSMEIVKMLFIVAKYLKRWEFITSVSSSILRE